MNDTAKNIEAVPKALSDKDAAIAEALAALAPLAAIPFEQFDYQDRGDYYPLMSWNGTPITLGDVKRARAVLAKYKP